MSFPRTLEGLTPREAIADALQRVIIGIDANDLEMYNSGFSWSADPGFILNGEATSAPDVFKRVGHMDTTHMISNVRIDYKEGATTASMTANAIAQHGRPGQGLDGTAPRFMSGGIYFIDLVKEEDEWKIARWDLRLKWVQGDSSVMQG